jgi:Xaa-Pro aminopeptidase
MRTARPGVYEREVAGAMEGLALARGGRLSFPVIFSVHGETLHNHHHGNRMQAGQLAVNDSGAEAPSHYAGDITRTLPIGGRFVGVHRDLYEAVLRAQLAAIEAIRPDVPYRDVHLLACRSLATDLKALGIVRGAPEAAVEAGAHALFMPHGLGHMLGLDVHDMENLGEDHVGYDDAVRRSQQFGLRSLRFGRAPQPGFVLTVEPGLYFIPALIDRWEAEGRCADHLDYAAIARFRDAGGIRIEDNVVVTASGCRVLGPPIPKAPAEVEELLLP